MLIYPTIKQAPFSGVTGYGGGATGPVLHAPKLVFTQTNTEDWDLDQNFSPSTPNSGVGIASISPDHQANALSSQWSMALTDTALNTDRPTGLKIRMQGTNDNTHFGFAKKPANSATYNNTIRDSSISYCLSWGWEGNYHNDPGGHGTDAGDLTGGFGQDEWITFIVDPINEKDIKIYDGGDNLVHTVSLSSGFISEITAGNIYAMSDQYSQGGTYFTKINYSIG